ncbi:hypothetical protein [Actinocorallia populi]|uniref:hypothetical protein n=1 Tax=Actinocorallia populi TaxID=2079200 RepID=UPI000D088EAA|nr:hypothetical protein [Actinocorallia populi]
MTTKTTEELPADGIPEDSSEVPAAEETEVADTEAAVEKTPEKAEPESSAAKPRPRRTPRLSAGLSRRLIVAALALVFLTAVVTAGIQWREADRLADQNGTEQQVRDRSADFARALLAYRHTELDATQKRIRDLTSADFGNSYQSAFDGLSEVITKYKADATATVRDVYLNGLDGGRAKTLVTLDSEVRSTIGVRQVLGTKLLLELVLEKGSWRVDAMSTLPADDETLTKPDGTVEDPSQKKDDTAETTDPQQP